MTPLRPIHSLALLGLLTVVALSGCSLLPDIPLPGGGQPSNQHSESEPGEESLEDDLEENPFIEQTMPANFPGDVPVPDLEILLALDLGTGWTIGYTTDDAVAAFDELADRYVVEGWEELSREASADQAFAAYDSAEYQVQLNAATDDTGFDTPVLSITVVRKN